MLKRLKWVSKQLLNYIFFQFCVNLLKRHNVKITLEVNNQSCFVPNKNKKKRVIKDYLTTASDGKITIINKKK